MAPPRGHVPIDLNFSSRINLNGMCNAPGVVSLVCVIIASMTIIIVIIIKTYINCVYCSIVMSHDSSANQPKESRHTG